MIPLGNLFYISFHLFITSGINFIQILAGEMIVFLRMEVSYTRVLLGDDSGYICFKVLAYPIVKLVSLPSLGQADNIDTGEGSWQHRL